MQLIRWALFLTTNNPPAMSFPFHLLNRISNLIHHCRFPIHLRVRFPTHSHNHHKVIKQTSWSGISERLICNSFLFKCQQSFFWISWCSSVSLECSRTDVYLDWMCVLAACVVWCGPSQGSAGLASGFRPVRAAHYLRIDRWASSYGVRMRSLLRVLIFCYLADTFDRKWWLRIPKTCQVIKMQNNLIT